MQYKGFGDNFLRKLGIFEDTCRKAGLLDAGKPLALSFMLKDSALDFYYDSISPAQPSFPKACDMITTYFEGPEWQQGIKNEWHTITLRSTIDKNPDKSTTECLLIMLRALRTLQHGLRDNQRDVETLRDKVLDACRGIPATASACSNPSPQFGAFINQLKASILTHKALPNTDSRPQYPTETTTPTEFFTDRRFQRQDQSTYNNKDPRSRSTSKTLDYRCFICQKPDCHSSRHTREERDAAWLKYRAESSRRHGYRLDNKAQHLIAEIEGSGSNEEPTTTTLWQPHVNIDVEEPETDTSFFTTQGPFTPTEAQDIYHSLCVNSTFHAITRSSLAPNYNPGHGNYSCQQFFGILIDTGAAKHSTCGYGQFLALQSIIPLKLDTQALRHGFRFGIGNITSLGTTEIPLPLGNVTFYVVQADTPFLLSLADMTHHHVYLNNVSKELVRDYLDPKTWPVIEHRGHMFLDWQNSKIPTTAYPFEIDIAYHLQETDVPPQISLSDTELRHLHRRFGYPSVRRLLAVLQRAGYDDIAPKTVQNITKLCHLCQKHDKAPGRFKFTIKDSDSIQFNHTILVDIMYIDGTPVLHVVDDATGLQAARWLPDMTTKTIWYTLRHCWIDVYIGPPDYIVTDAGKNLTSKEFQQNAHLLGTSTKAVPVEAHWSIGKVERYHAILRRAYTVITADAPDIDKTTALQMAVKAINDIASPNGLVPTFLAFGAFPRINQFDMPAASVTARAHAIQKAMSEITKLHAQRSIRDALHTRNGPDVEPIHDLPIGSKVLVWREGPTGQSGSWTGPHTLLSLTSETCEIQLDRNHSTPASFRTTHVKPYLEETDAQHDPSTEANDKLRLDTITVELPERRNLGRTRRLPNKLARTDVDLYLNDDDFSTPDIALTSEYDILAYTRQPPFTESRTKEINGLIERGVFEIVLLSAIPAGTRLFTSRFVDQIKFPGTPKEQEKSRLVVRAYQDHGKEEILVQSLTI